MVIGFVFSFLSGLFGISAVALAAVAGEERNSDAKDWRTPFYWANILMLFAVTFAAGATAFFEG